MCPQMNCNEASIKWCTTYLILKDYVREMINLLLSIFIDPHSYPIFLYNFYLWGYLNVKFKVTIHNEYE